MPEPTYDHQLVFGVLALQIGFIDREQLVAATDAWLPDKRQSMEGILRAADALSDEDVELLNRVVKRDLENHDGDTEKSLAALSEVGSVVQSIRASAQADAEVTRSMAECDHPTQSIEPTITYEASADSQDSQSLRHDDECRYRFRRWRAWSSPHRLCGRVLQSYKAIGTKSPFAHSPMDEPGFREDFVRCVTISARNRLCALNERMSQPSS